VNVLPTRLTGPILVEPHVFADGRGFFLESYRHEAYRAIGINAEFVQDNHSRSVLGTIRALHFQLTPGQPKLVRVARGRVWDVILDLRRSSSTFGEWEGFELDDERHLQLFIPIGFAHGFYVMSDVADVVYMVGSYYDPATERGIAWDDPELGIRWPPGEPIVSDRDRRNPRLAEIQDQLPDW
jgi:dTDP-4-dehydrorhamnose 3,5-epimerase